MEAEMAAAEAEARERRNTERAAKEAEAQAAEVAAATKREREAAEEKAAFEAKKALLRRQNTKADSSMQSKRKSLDASGSAFTPAPAASPANSFNKQPATAAQDGTAEPHDEVRDPDTEVDAENEPSRRPGKKKRMGVSAEAGGAAESFEAHERRVFVKPPEDTAFISSVVSKSTLFAGVTDEQSRELVDAMQVRIPSRAHLRSWPAAFTASPRPCRDAPALMCLAGIAEDSHPTAVSAATSAQEAVVFQGETVIKQGEEGNNFYVVRSGEYSVLLKQVEPGTPTIRVEPKT